MKVARIKADYKRAAWALAREAMGVEWCPPRDGKLHLSVTFCPPDKKRRDLDNMLASIKSGLDGISQATGCDDSLWSFTIAKADPVTGGKVSIIVAAAMAPGVSFKGSIE